RCTVSDSRPVARHCCISGGSRRCATGSPFAKAAAAAGDQVRAEKLADQAMATAQAITDPDWRARILGDFGEGSCACGCLGPYQDPERAGYGSCPDDHVPGSPGEGA